MDQAIVVAMEQDAERRRLEIRIEELAPELDELEAGVHYAKTILEGEHVDVARLRGAHPFRIWWGLLGQLGERRAIEEAEHAEAVARYDSVVSRRDELARQLDTARRRRIELDHAEAQLAAAVEAKAAELDAPSVLRRANKWAEARRQIDELQEASDAAAYATDCLSIVRSHLRKAGNWGIVDLAGADLIGAWGKYEALGNAQYAGKDLQCALSKLRRELADMGRGFNATMTPGRTLSFADFFVDHLVTDWLVQSRIAEAQHQATGLANELDHLQDQLGLELAKCAQRARQAHDEYNRAVLLA